MSSGGRWIGFDLAKESTREDELLCTTGDEGSKEAELTCPIGDDPSFFNSVSILSLSFMSVLYLHYFISIN